MRFFTEPESGFITCARTSLPRNNVAVLQGDMSVAAWMAAIRPLVPVPGAGFDIKAIRNGETLRTAVLVTAQSTARLEAELEFERGSLMRQMPELEELFLAVDPEGLGLTADRYWLDNGGAEPFTFSGAPGECWFIRAVRTQTAFAMNVNEMLRLVCDRDLPVDGTDTHRMLASAASSLEQTQLLYRDFYRGPDGQPMMTARGFNDMRNWLLPVVVRGTTYEPPNAAFIAPMASTDFLHGSTSPQHRAYVEKFVPSLPPSDQWAIEEDMERPSVIAIFAEALGYATPSDLDTATESEIADRMLADPGLAANCEGLCTLHDFFVGASGAHLGLVIKMLVRFDEGLTDEERASMPLKPDTGVGGNGVEHLRRLHESRRTAAGYAGLRRGLKDVERRGTAS